MWTTTHTLGLSLGLPASLTALVLGVIAILKCFCPLRYASLKDAVKCCDKKKRSQDNGTKKVEGKKNEGIVELQPKDTDPFIPPSTTERPDRPTHDGDNSLSEQPVEVHVEDNRFDQHNSGQSNDKTDGDDIGPDHSFDQPKDEIDSNDKVTEIPLGPIHDESMVLVEDHQADVAIPVPDYADSSQVAGTNPDVAIPVPDYADGNPVAGTNPDTPIPLDHIDTMRDNIDHKILCKIKEELLKGSTLTLLDMKSFCVCQTWDGLLYARLRSQHHAQSPLLMAVDLANDFIGYKMAPGANPCNDNASALRKLGDEMISKLDAEYKNILDEMKFSVDENGYEQFQNLVDSMLKEGDVNWGRIIMVFVVGAKLTMKYNYTNLVFYTGNIIHEKFTPWIKQNGGWDSLQGLNASSSWLYNIFSWFSFPWM